MNEISSTVLIIIALALLFAGALIVLDSKRTRDTKRLRRSIRTYILANAMKSFSVFIDVDGPAETLMPLLRHLERHDYQQLQVILVLNETSDPSAAKELRRYQQKMRGVIDIRVVKQKVGADFSKLVRRYANGDAVMRLNADERLHDRFFNDMSLELLDDSTESIAPRVSPVVKDSLRSAVNAINHILAQAFISKPSPASARIYKRESYQEAVGVRPIMSRTTMTSPVNGIRVSIVALVALIAIAVPAFVVAAIGLESWKVLVAAYVAIIVLFIWLQILQYPNRATTKLSLMMLVPLWPIVGTIMLIVQQTIGLIHAARKSPDMSIQERPAK